MMDRRIKLCLIKILRKGELYTMDLFSKIITGIVAVSTAIVTVAMVVQRINNHHSIYQTTHTVRIKTTDNSSSTIITTQHQ